MPIYSQEPERFGASDLCNILLSFEYKACSTRPLGVTENILFVIDLDFVHFEDLKADDLGCWKSTGVKRKDFRIASNCETRYYEGCSSAKNHYSLIGRYYVHGTCCSFHRLIVSIEGK